MTNKPEQFTHPLLAHFQIDKLFGAVIGGDTTAARKPNAKPLLHALAELNSPPGRSLMVGDSINDFRAAKNADMGCVMVTWGYHQQQDPATLGALAVINISMSCRPFYLAGYPACESPGESTLNRVQSAPLPWW